MIYASRLDIPGDLEAFIMASATAGVGSKAAELRTNANHVPSRGNGTGTRGGRAKGRGHEKQATEKPKRRGTFSARVTPILNQHIPDTSAIPTRFNHRFNDNPEGI
jgi:hypothetical protein